MITITDAFIDALSDYKDEHGWTDFQLAHHLHVNHGTMSRWFSARIGAIRDTAFEKLPVLLGLDPNAFEKGVVIDAEFRTKLREALKTRRIGMGSWDEKWRKRCGVSARTVLCWFNGTSRSMRLDVYRHICEVLEWDIGFRSPVPACELPPYQKRGAITGENTIRREEQPDDSWDDPASSNPQVLQIPVSLLTRVWVVPPGVYEKMMAKAQHVNYEGKVRLYKTEDGEGPVQISIAGGGTLVADGERIAVTTGKRKLVAGRLHLLPILVRSDTYNELQDSE